MKVAVQDLPPEGRSFVFQGHDWLPDQGETVGEVRADLHLRREGSRVLVAGSLELKIRQCCDRCLTDFILPLTASFQVEFELEGGEGAQPGSDHRCSSGEMDTEYLDGSEIDLHELLQQQYFLTMPAKILCTENCKGLCSKCGSNLNLRECHCQQESFSAFGVLRTLLK